MTKFRFSVGVLSVVFLGLGLILIRPTTHAQVANILTNPGFESGNLTGWSGNSNSISTTVVHSGTYAAKLTNGSVVQKINTTAGITYKATAWIKIDAETGSDWGGLVFDVTKSNNQDFIIRSPVLLTASNGSGWFQQALTFTATSTTTYIDVAYWGGPGRQITAYVDDFSVFVKPASNSPPTAMFNASTTNISTLPNSVNFTSTATDTDGAITNYFWDFGDGSKSNQINPSHNYIGNGDFLVKLRVEDDDGAIASIQSTVHVLDASYPVLTIAAPANPATVSTAQVNFSGTASSNVIKVDWSTDRGLYGSANLGLGNWNFSVDLTGSGGNNQVLVVGYDSSGRAVSQTVAIYFTPASPINISGVTTTTASVDKYDKFETSFNVNNSVADNPYFPYETNLPAGMAQTGISVEGIFTSPSGKVYHQPGFLYQTYNRSAISETQVATGNPIWKVRFAPNETGTWSYQIKATDASGTTTSSINSFSAVPPSNPLNHGFVRNSAKDNRYFEFDDGTPFVGIGPGVPISDSFSTVNQNASVGAGGANFTRTWMSGANIGGSAWVPYTGGLPYDGNVSGSGLTTEEAYGNGIFSLKLTQSGPQCAFFGWNGVKATIKANTNYRLLMRLKTVGVTGSGGVTFRANADWPDTCNKSASMAKTIPYQSGNGEWHTVTGTWNSGSANAVGIGLIAMENTTAGTVYVDEVSIREVLSSGQLGPEVLPRSKFNLQNYFSQESSLNWDIGLDDQARLGMYQKIVMEEKQDYAFNHIAPSGYGLTVGDVMQNNRGATLKYQQYYWRYLTARYGYSRAIHSWEFDNEDGPGNFTFANVMANYISSLDSHYHLKTTSFWACNSTFSDCNWQATGPGKTYTGMNYADAHAYVSTVSGGTTSWLGTIDPISNGNMINDSALYVTGHSLQIFNNNLAGNKPIIMGESGIINGGTTVGQNDTDTKGVWLHQFLWAQVNPGGVYFPGYWWTNTINSNNLYPIFKPFRAFMEGSTADTINKRIPINNGKYQDIGLTLPSGIRGWGQKDVTNGGAFFWMYDQNYTWTTPTGGTSLANKQVSFSGLPAGSYVIEYWNTWTGQVVSASNSFAGGVMTLTVPATLTNTDVAIKIIPAAGFSSPLPTSAPSTAPSPTKVLVPGDANGDSHVDGIDYVIWLNHYGSTVSGPTVGDFNSDGKVDGVDYVIWLNNYGK